jgi:predicted thioesterase
VSNPEYALTRTVTEADAASAYGSHFPPVASTPFVLGLAEVACHNAVAGDLGDGEVTVGTRAVVDHLAPSPVGVRLVARASLRERQGRRMVFDVEVFDGEEVVARVEHVRAVARSAKIEERLAAR